MPIACKKPFICYYYIAELKQDKQYEKLRRRSNISVERFHQIVSHLLLFLLQAWERHFLFKYNSKLITLKVIINNCDSGIITRNRETLFNQKLLSYLKKRWAALNSSINLNPVPFCVRICAGGKALVPVIRTYHFDMALEVLNCVTDA